MEVSDEFNLKDIHVFDNNEESIGLFSSTHFLMEQSRIYDRIEDYKNMKYYLHKCINNGCVDAMFHLANYYDEINDYKNMIYYYEKAANLNDVESIYNLGYHYYLKKDIKNMFKWYSIGKDLDDLDCICELAKYYDSIKDYEKVIEYYTYCITFKYLNAYYLYGIWLSKRNKLQMSILYISAFELYQNNEYFDNQKYKIRNNVDNENIINKIARKLADYFDTDLNDKENAIKYYLFCINRGCTESMYNLGIYYYEHNDIENMFKYYLMGIELKDIDCMFELSIYYQGVNDIENMKKYYLLALEEIENSNLKDKTFVNDGEKDFNLFKLKEILDSVDNPSKTVTNKIKKINSIKDIIIFDNKKKLFASLNHVVECGICYETCLNINLNCGHCVCTTCYPHLYNKACPFCRF